MKTGQINVQTENIFPIIKKFLYSDHEIFLRELVSNAVDASQKLKFLSSNGEFKGELGELKVEVILDKKEGTLTIRDNGIGMTEDEIDKYINQIAFSGAEEFVKQYEGKEGAEQIIGHFGLGFYSAFMVAEKVQIKTLSRHEGSKAVQGVLDKYCKFLPQPVFFGMRTVYEDDESGEKDENGKVKRVSLEVPNQVNNVAPAWTKAPADLTIEDYQGFYRELYPATMEDPLFHIHLNVDYPFNLTGILYFPKISENVEVQKNKINLYSNQVFITDNVEEIVPEFLTLLHGVIDSPDIPLNVSRSYLQSDGNVKKISSHITKKVADKLAQMFKKDRDDFESKWEDLKIFVQYGTLSDDKFAEKSDKFTLLKNTKGEHATIEEYKEKIAALQTNKDAKLVMLYTNDPQEQFGFVKKANDRGYDVLHLDGPLAPHWIAKLEQSNDNIMFVRVDSDTLDKLIQKDEEIPSKLSKEDEDKLKPLFEEVVNKEKYSVQFESMNSEDAPVIITQPEFIRRMMEQQKMGGGGFMGAFPDMRNMVVNANHEKVGDILNTKTKKSQERKIKQLTDIALLSQGLLKGEELNEFIERSIELI